MKRSPIKRATTPIKRNPIKRKKTSRLSSYDVEFEKMKELVRERSKGRCEVTRFLSHDAILVTLSRALFFWDGQETRCRGKGEHVHHRKLRKQGGSNSLDNLLHVCHPCHEAIHANPATSYNLRLLVHEWESEEL